MRISTQVYVLVDGNRKVMEFTAPDGTTRALSVDIDLSECIICGALVMPPAETHADWHQTKYTELG